MRQASPQRASDTPNWPSDREAVLYGHAATPTPTQTACSDSGVSPTDSPTDSDAGYAPREAAMDVRDKVVRARETGTPRKKATSLLRVWTKRVHKLSDDTRDKVLKAVESGMTCRQAAACCGVSLASAIRFAKRAGITDKRAEAKEHVRDNVR